MKVLVACEESQALTERLRLIGHEAYSCDIIDCSGSMPEYHLKCDVREILYDSWDFVIAFPPCTDLTVSGNASRDAKRKDGRLQKSIDFFMLFTELDKYCIENPVGIMSTLWRKPDQIINPWQFGHMEQKRTCLWLKGLPKLLETNNVKSEMMKLPKNIRERLHYLPPSKDRAKLRSKTYSGIADAMVKQWFGVQK